MPSVAGVFLCRSDVPHVSRTFSWHDDETAPAVAVVNQQFAGSMFGSVRGAVGQYYKLQNGTRVQVVGVVEDEKYLSLNEDPPACHFSFLISVARRLSHISWSARGATSSHWPPASGANCGNWTPPCRLRPTLGSGYSMWRFFRHGWRACPSGWWG